MVTSGNNKSRMVCFSTWALKRTEYVDYENWLLAMAVSCEYWLRSLHRHTVKSIHWGSYAS